MDISTARSYPDELLLSLVPYYLEDLKSRHNLRVVGLTTDSCASYARTRRIVRAKKRDLAYLPCFAHQINPMLGEKSVLDYMETAKKATKIVALINASTYHLEILKKRQRDLKVPQIVHIKQCDTCWQLYGRMTSALLRREAPLKVNYDGLPRNFATLSTC